MRNALALLLTLSLATPATAANTFGDALAAYFLEDYEAALDGWRGLAADGDTPSKFYLGLLHETGRGTQKDINAAIGWYRQAADAGHAEAAYRLARLARQSNRLPAEPETVLAWIEQAAEGGIAEAQYELGAYLAEGKLVERDLARARDWFAAAENAFGDQAKQRQAARMRAMVEARLTP